MGQEFFVKSTTLEDKVRQILPSQGGLGQGFDLSASTQIVPIVDLTESAEGSTLRQDLQTAISFDNATAFDVQGTVSTIINNTGYFRIFGSFSTITVGGSNKSGFFTLTDGTSFKNLVVFRAFANSNTQSVVIPFDFTVFLNAGDSINAETSSNTSLTGSTRQIATINGELINP